MNKFAKICLKDLETQRYPQTKGKLQALNGACCCLGVMTRRYIDEGGELKVVRGGTCMAFYQPGADYSEEGSLPHVVRSKIGFKTNDGSFEIDSKAPNWGFKKRLPKQLKARLQEFINENYYVEDKVYGLSLAMLNDSGFTHQELAKIIKAEPDGLFEQIS